MQIPGARAGLTQSRADTAGLRPLSACGCPWLVCGSLGFGRGSLSLNSPKQRGFCWHLLSLGSWDVGMFRAGGADWGPAPNKTLGAAPLMSFLAPLSAGGRACPCGCPGRGVWKPADSLANCAVSFRRDESGRECDCVPRPESSEWATEPGDGVGDPDPPPRSRAVPAFP